MVEEAIGMKDRKKIGKAALLAAFCLLCGILYSCRPKEEAVFESAAGALKEDAAVQPLEPSPEEFPATADPLQAKADQEPVPMFVYVCGAVARPGVYEVDADTRIFEAIEAAGGVTEDAAEEYLNLAQPVTDGQKILVPTQEETRELEQSGALENPPDSVEEARDGLVNINTAGEDLLMTLPGIGASKAQSIITYREVHGDFKTIDEIKKIEGIKEGVFRKIKDLIRVK